MKVLLIEDNPDDVLAVERLARASPAPVQLTEISDGASALEWLTFGGVQPDLILLDLALPGLPGGEVLRQLKAHSQLHDIPVIVVSGTQQDADILEGVRLGAHSHIVKPIGQSDFAWIVASVLRAQPRLSALRGAQGKG